MIIKHIIHTATLGAILEAAEKSLEPGNMEDDEVLEEIAELKAKLQAHIDSKPIIYNLKIESF